jgi:transmembrane sensor
MRLPVSTASEIEASASDWLVRRESGDWSEAEQVRLDQWLNESTLNRVAFLRLELAWEDAARLKALGAGVRSDGPPPPGHWNISPFYGAPAPIAEQARRPRLRAAYIAFAASLLVAVVAAGYWRFVVDAGRYSTAVGMIASVAIADGSKVTLNTNSRIRVALSDAERRIELQRGEAFFDVSKDPHRPFVVRVGDKRVIAVGTRFSVRRFDDEIEVVVTEGKVKVESPSTDVTNEASSRESASGDPLQPHAPADVLLVAGSVARASEAGVLMQRKSVPEAEAQLSWRVGVLVFRDRNLGEAIAEFNRYNERHIVIDDPALAQLKIEGNFRATNLDAFVRLIESGFPVRVEQHTDRIVLTAR